jgi:hypothetical protein
MEYEVWMIRKGIVIFSILAVMLIIPQIFTLYMSTKVIPFSDTYMTSSEGGEIFFDKKSC